MQSTSHPYQTIPYPVHLHTTHPHQLQPLYRELHTRHGLHCFIQLPIGPAARPLGALLLAKRTPNCFEDARCVAHPGAAVDSDWLCWRHAQAFSLQPP